MGETYDFSDGFDEAFIVRHDLKKMTCESVQLTMLTYSESLFKGIMKSSVTIEKLLVVNIHTSLVAYERGDIRKVGWIRSPENVPDGLTKFARCKALARLMDRGRLNPVVVQWVIRTGIPSGGTEVIANLKYEEGIDEQVRVKDEGENHRWNKSSRSNEIKKGGCEKYTFF